ncbi:uncharacterized protein CEXT_141731 [Caerostris extrusa]|uniref:Uncharacterized protein n=1 Tax=Caerostris extrusa TaxID=172846 RepID=A0AAV4QTM6_CAEEX|nr:uncharacterized protein CEXT_141731 [Caerostris extrusa]
MHLLSFILGNTPTCPAEKYLEVRWSKTAANTEDIQFCPKGYTGEVRRHCNLKKDDEAVWGRTGLLQMSLQRISCHSG